MIITGIEERNNAVIISMSGELSLSNIEEFENVFKKYTDSDFNVAALEMGHVPYLNSFGISRIIKVSRTFINNNKDFVLINMNENIHQIFRMSTFDKIFNIMSNEEFNEKYFPLEKHVKIIDTGISTEDQELKCKSVTTQVELVDDNGTTLVFIDED